MVKFRSKWIIMQFKYSLDEPKVVVFKFKESSEHVDEMLLILDLTNLVGCSAVGLFLNDTSGVIKGTCGHEALLSSRSLDVENEAISWELLTGFDSKNVSNFNILPRYGNPAFYPSRYHEPLDLLGIDEVGDTPLPEFKSQVLKSHEAHVNGDCCDRESNIDLVVLL